MPQVPNRPHRNLPAIANYIGPAIAQYAADNPGGEKDQHIGDLLCDLRHYCDMEGIDFAECDRQGAMHYRDERAHDAQ